jgi:hypothetical protein
MITKQQEIVGSMEGLFVLADQLELRLAMARGQLDQLPPSLLARAWTHSLPARLGCALSLREILFPRSQRIQIAGQLVPQDPTDEAAYKLVGEIFQAKKDAKRSHENRNERTTR